MSELEQWQKTKLVIDISLARAMTLEEAREFLDGIRGYLDLARAVIAELDAELATVNSLLDMKREREQHWSDEAWRYRDELAALMARRCEGCASCDTCPVQNAAWVKFGALEADTGFSCNCWAERKAT